LKKYNIMYKVVTLIIYLISKSSLLFILVGFIHNLSVIVSKKNYLFELYIE